MKKIIDKKENRIKRHKRVRAKVSGTSSCPRLNVFRSAKHIYAQLIDDVAGVTLCSASTLEKGFEGFGGNAEAAKKVGLALAEKARPRELPTWYLTVPATFITEEWPRWQTAPVKAD